MFVGHYGISLALKKYDKTLSLGFLFIAVQLLDIAFFIFLPLGIENMRIVPGFTQYNSYDFYNLPFTHSLLGTIIWASATYLVFRYLILRNPTRSESEKARTAFIMGIAVFSHFILDFFVLTPQLPVIPGIDFKIGLGLWNFLFLAMTLELAFLLGGIWIYFKSTTSGTGFVGEYGMQLFMFVLIIVAIITPFLPDPSSLLELSIQGEFLFAIFAGVAFWLDGKRSVISKQ